MLQDLNEIVAKTFKKSHIFVPPPQSLPGTETVILHVHNGGFCFRVRLSITDNLSVELLFGTWVIHRFLRDFPYRIQTAPIELTVGSNHQFIQCISLI